MRRRSRPATPLPGSGFPVWMITYSDLVTLLMTFFVMLVSMASLTDEYKRKEALGSVSGSFGTGSADLDDLTINSTNQNVTPGPMNLFRDLEPLRKRLRDQPDSDLKFESNKYIQRLSMDAETLFTSGNATLTPAGIALLDRVRPFLVESTYPLCISGHTGVGRDELGNAFQPSENRFDFSWQLSLSRASAVYRYLLHAGIPAERMRLEAFGQFHPKASNDTPEGRKANRRVDITLDTRIGSWTQDMAQMSADDGEKKGESFSIRNFLFRFELPGGQ